MLPEIEAQFAQLNRDYEVQKRNYESLVTRRESAVLTTELDATTGVTDFRIVDPPTVSQTPVAPNRMLLFPLVLVVSLGAGVFASFALSQISPTFHDARTLRELTHRPVLGSVELHPSPELLARRRAGHFMFAGSIAGLFVLLGGAMVLVSVTRLGM
jgi:G-rich domain on putative tyrosine kinase